MLNINLEFIRGMLFVRLSGKLDDYTYTKLSNCLDDMINDKGFKYFIVNLEELLYVDEMCLQKIIDRYFDVAKHDGKLIICGYENKFNQTCSILKRIEHANNELSALKLINI